MRSKQAGSPVNATQSLRANNFDLLRLVFATTVFLVHGYVLSNSKELAWLTWIFSSEIAVRSFFVVSGFLIFMSYENSNSIGSYFSKRVRRVYPAYFSIIFLCAFAGALFTTVSWDYYFSTEWLKYLIANLIFLNFLQPTLLGLFSENPIQAVDGALWTLKIEVMFYLCVPLFVIAMRTWGRWPILLGIYMLSLIYVAAVEVWGVKTGSDIYLALQRQLPGQLTFFVSGATLYYYLDIFKQRWLWLLLPSIGVFVIKPWVPVAWVEPMALAVVVIYFACVFPCLGNFGKYGDFSYGIYITHFPILQILISAGVFDYSPFFGFTVAGVFVFITAYVFWHFIEKPFLKKSSHYVEANRK